MIIEFPKKYDVWSFSGGYFVISVPQENLKDLHSLLIQQAWVSTASISLVNDIILWTSKAYDITTEQAKQALEQLCEFVMSPPVPMDNALGDELSAILSEEPL